MADIEKLHRKFLQSTGACTDSRKLLPKGMFFALRGPNFDANAFAAEALKQGCSYAVVDDPNVATDHRFIVVADVLNALQELALHHRRTFDIPFIGITGSNGKTTTKELLYAVLSADRPTLATTGNLNNHIGVPLTLLRLTLEHRIAIIEMGANKVGDIAELTALAEPTHGMITNIGKAHLEGFGGAEGVLIGKTEMYAFVKQHGGTLFVNGDDPLLMEKSSGIPRVTYGTEEGVQTRGRSMAEDAFLTVVFSGRDGDEHQARTRLVGAYNLPNALAAIAIGQHFGIADDRIAGALEAYSPSNSRSQFTDTGRNQLVLDAYNANPTSMAAALENFARLPSDRRKLAILGDMRELGPTSALEHQAIVHQLEKLGIETMLVGGEFMNTNGGSSLRRFADADAVLKALTEEQPHASIILIKGSRGIKLETVIPAL